MGLKSKLIYMASPYSNEDHNVEVLRFDRALGFTTICHANGYKVYSPIVFGHMLRMRGEFPGRYDFWEEFNHLLLSRSDELWVYMLDGWETSVGVTWEMNTADSLGKFIRMIDPSLGLKSNCVIIAMEEDEEMY